MNSKKRSDVNKSNTLKQHQRSTQTTPTPANNASPREKISYSIVHATPGRIRFRIPRLTRDSEYADKLKLMLESTPNITNVRVNPRSASIVINYQADTVSDEQMRSHLIQLIQTAPCMPLS
ncbi:hypothetical protein QUB80_15685 [Chlorogloeopsis sp. ULAP01]|uniref:HMA2 domain-containing protein n=1 Tax=Chlorogloeopsis sp. ULAP01 TaxID=3056483 RepID=UPI0025AA7C54|nr:hypothetical protein [Chlorogloeopsis sp. ULAP01]MDM9382144.1 hypothetical protein [Chlorogloeopsis sp. ULAP01]